MVVHEKEGKERSVLRPLHLHSKPDTANGEFPPQKKFIGLTSHVHP